MVYQEEWIDSLVLARCQKYLAIFLTKPESADFSFFDLQKETEKIK